MFRIALTLLLLAVLSLAQQPASQPPSAPGSAADLVKQGEKLNAEGKQDEALGPRSLRQSTATIPRSV